MKKEILKHLACPVCLGSLNTSEDIDEIQETKLSCTSCQRSYDVHKGLPFFLLQDQEWSITKTEIEGEKELVVELPVSEHIRRNQYESWRTWEYLKKERISPNPLVLDVGGSSGIGAYLFNRFHAEVMVLDIVPALLKIGEEFLKDKMKAHFMTGAMEWLPFQSNTFDVVFCRQALHHSTNPYQALLEMFRVTRLGGKVILCGEPCISLADLLRSKIWGVGEGPIEWRKSEILNKLQDAHFLYTWPDFHRLFSHFSKDFKISRGIGYTGIVATSEGLRFESHCRRRGTIGKILDRILPLGRGYRGDINITATKTVSVDRDFKIPNLQPISSEIFGLRDLTEKERNEYASIFPSFFETNEDYSC